MTKSAVVLLSGGLDSATVLAIAKSQGYTCAALSFDYGQRHKAELNAARAIAQAYGVVRHETLTLDFGKLGGSSLTDMAQDVCTTGVAAGIPSTYVPARNTIMLSIALGFAEIIGAHDMFIGVNAVDYSGYPDCRPEYIAAFETMANLATKMGVEGQKLTIHTPIITFSKADIIKHGTQLGVDFALTVSCYQADETGAACGQCDSCRLRATGFAAAHIKDNTRYQATI